MSNFIKSWMVGGLLAVTALSLTFGTASLGSAAAKSTAPAEIMQKQCEAGTDGENSQCQPVVKESV